MRMRILAALCRGGKTFKLFGQRPQLARRGVHEDLISRRRRVCNEMFRKSVHDT